MTQCQRARYRVAGYFIINNVRTATLDSKMKNAWKRRWQKRNWNSLNSLYLGVSDSFKDDSSKLNNHSVMAVVKSILALSVQIEFCFILWLFSLRFCMEMIWNWIIRIDSWFFSFVEVWMKKKKKKKKKKNLWRAAVLKLVSFPVYLGCYALHYGIMYVSILYTLYIQIVC